MYLFTRLKIYFWNIDPGYFNLKQAFKTVLAIGITLLLLREQTLLTKFMGGIACGFSMQGVTGKTWAYRLLHVILFALIYLAAFILGLMVSDSPYLTALTLVIIGFFANYIRRFGLENSFAPLMIWMLCFLATILPLANSKEAYDHMGALVLGFLVSGMVSLLVFPENYSSLLIKNSNLFFHTLSTGFSEIRRYLLGFGQEQDFKVFPFVRVKKDLTDLMDINQTLQHLTAASSKKRLNHILFHQYGLLNAYILMLEAYQSLTRIPKPLALSTRLHLIRVNKKFAEVLGAIKMQKDWKMITQQELRLMMPLSYPKAPLPKEPALIIALLNLKLGFDMAKKHLRELMQGEIDA